MKYLHIILSGLVLVAATAVTQAQIVPVTPVIEEYNRMLASAPDDYDLLLSRAQEYMAGGQYLPALDDLNRVLLLAPKDEKEIRFEALITRGTVRKLQGDYDNALVDLTEAVRLYPKSATPLIERADVYLRMGKTDLARADYLEVLRQFPRDADATFGVARVAASAGDSNEAMLYANRGVELAPRSSESFLSKAEVFRLLGREDDAIDCWIEAIFCDDAGSSRAAQTLIDEAVKDYPGVYQGFSRAVMAQPSAGILYYLRGSIAQEHCHFVDALDDYARIDRTGPFVNGRLIPSISRSLYGMGRYEQAEKQLATMPQNLREAEWYAISSLNALALKDVDRAIALADTAVMLNPDDVEPLTVRARALMGAARDSEAAIELAKAIMTDNSRPELYLLRAEALKRLGRDTEAATMYEQLLDLPADPTDATSLRGFAMLGLGNDTQADGWLGGVLTHGEDSDGHASLIAAVLASLRGDDTRAAALLDAALAKGYADRSLIDAWMPADRTPYVEVLSRHADIFVPHSR